MKSEYVTAFFGGGGLVFHDFDRNGSIEIRAVCQCKIQILGCCHIIQRNIDGNGTSGGNVFFGYDTGAVVIKVMPGLVAGIDLVCQTEQGGSGALFAGQL